MGGKFSDHAAFCHTPELSIALLYGEHSRTHLPVDLIIHIIPVHDAVFVFLRHTVSNEGLEYLALVITEAVTLQFCAGVLDVAPFVPLIEIGCKGHIQLHSGGLRRQDGKTVLSDD